MVPAQPVRAHRVRRAEGRGYRGPGNSCGPRIWKVETASVLNPVGLFPKGITTHLYYIPDLALHIE